MLYALAVSAVVLCLFVYFSLDPAKTPFPRCPFKMLTGLNCPGCGSQRALHQLLHFHILEALRYNALFVLALPLLAFLAFAEIFKERFPRLYLASISPILSWSILSVVLIWFVVRNIIGI